MIFVTPFILINLELLHVHILCIHLIIIAFLLLFVLFYVLFLLVYDRFSSSGKITVQTNKDLLYNTWNSTQYSVIIYIRK